MKRKFTIYSTLIILIFGATSAVKENYFSTQPPSGRTGATGTYCTSCHTTNTLNSGGGSVITTGLPNGTYVAGQAYPFTLTINHGTADRQKWGFAIKAVNPAGGAVVGAFSTTNANAIVNGSSKELTHNNAVTTGSSNTFTYTNLVWTAPTASPPASVKFYFVGNAADGTGGDDNDFIYAANSTATLLPIILSSFTSTVDGNRVILNWQVESDLTTKLFEVERNLDVTKFETITSIFGSNSSIARKYNFIDTKPSNASVVYYRLKMFDKDGTITYSKMLSVNTKNSSNYVSNVYPNPVKKGQNVNIELVSDKEQTASFIIVNTLGKIISAKEKNITKGFNNVSFKMGNYLAADNYFLQIKMGNTVSKQFNIAVVE